MKPTCIQHRNSYDHLSLDLHATKNLLSELKREAYIYKPEECEIEMCEGVFKILYKCFSVLLNITGKGSVLFFSLWKASLSTDCGGADKFESSVFTKITALLKKCSCISA